MKNAKSIVIVGIMIVLAALAMTRGPNIGNEPEEGFGFEKTTTKSCTTDSWKCE